MEGEKLAGAVQKVLRHYDLPDVASETKDWIGLIIVAGSIYGPRMAAHWAEKNAPDPKTRKAAADYVAAHINKLAATPQSLIGLMRKVVKAAD